MKQELIYNILPIKAYEIELKCFYASHFILGRIFALWNKKKKEAHFPCLSQKQAVECAFFVQNCIIKSKKL